MTDCKRWDLFSQHVSYISAYFLQIQGLDFLKPTPQWISHLELPASLKILSLVAFCHLLPLFLQILLNVAKAVLVAILNFLAISRKDSSISRCCQITLQRISGEYVAFLPGSAGLMLDIALTGIYYWLGKFKLPANCLLAACAERNTQYALRNKSAVRSELKSAVT